MKQKKQKGINTLMVQGIELFELAKKVLTQNKGNYEAVARFKIVYNEKMEVCEIGEQIFEGYKRKPKNKKPVGSMYITIDRD